MRKDIRKDITYEFHEKHKKIQKVPCSRYVAAGVVCLVPCSRYVAAGVFLLGSRLRVTWPQASFVWLRARGTWLQAFFCRVPVCRLRGRMRLLFDSVLEIRGRWPFFMHISCVYYIIYSCVFV